MYTIVFKNKVIRITYSQKIYTDTLFFVIFLIFKKENYEGGEERGERRERGGERGEGGIIRLVELAYNKCSRDKDPCNQCSTYTYTYCFCTDVSFPGLRQCNLCVGR